MSAVPLARYLVDFGIGSETDTRHRGGALSEAEQSRARALAESEAAAKIAQSYARGLEEGRASAEAEWAGRFQAQDKAFEGQLVSERHAWAAKEGEALAARLTSGLSEIEARTADTVARILAPFLSAELRSAAIAELLVALQSVLSKAEGVRIEISGPADLLVRMRERLAGLSTAVTFSTREGPDVRVEVDQTVLETRLGAWSARLSGALR